MPYNKSMEDNIMHMEYMVWVITNFGNILYKSNMTYAEACKCYDALTNDTVPCFISQKLHEGVA